MKKLSYILVVLVSAIIAYLCFVTPPEFALASHNIESKEEREAVPDYYASDAYIVLFAGMLRENGDKKSKDICYVRAHEERAFAEQVGLAEHLEESNIESRRSISYNSNPYGCGVAFLGDRLDMREVKAFLKRSEGKGVLTMSRIEGFRKLDGAMIELEIIENRGIKKMVPMYNLPNLRYEKIPLNKSILDTYIQQGIRVGK